MSTRGAQRAPDEALDLLGSPARRLAAAVARLALGRVGAGMHLVLGGEPALPLAAQEIRDRAVDRCRAEHHGLARSVEHRALRGAVKAGHHLDRARCAENERPSGRGIDFV